MAGATGARSWLQNQHLTWLTPRRMRVVTATLFVAATIASSLVFSGSSAPPGHAGAHNTGPPAAASTR